MDKIRIAIINNFYSLPFLIAQKENLFGDNDLEVEFVNVYSIQEIAYLLLSQKVDLGELPLSFSWRLFQDSKLCPVLFLNQEKLGLFIHPNSTNKNLYIISNDSIESLYLKSIIQENSSLNKFQIKELSPMMIPQLMSQNLFSGIIGSLNLLPSMQNIDHIESKQLMSSQFVPRNVLNMSVGLSKTDACIRFKEVLKKSYSFINTAKSMSQLYLSIEPSDPYIQYNSKWIRYAIQSSRITSSDIFSNCPTETSYQNHIKLLEINKEKYSSIDIKEYYNILIDLESSSNFLREYNQKHFSISTISFEKPIQEQIHCEHKVSLLEYKISIYREQLEKLTTKLNKYKYHFGQLEFEILNFIEKSNDILIVVQAKTYEILIANRRFRNELGYSHESIKNLDLFQITSFIENKDSFEEILYINNMHATGVSLVHNDGFPIDVDLIFSEFNFVHKKQYLVHIINKTEETEINRAQNQFLSNVSHELKTPMTNIQGYIELIFLDPSISFSSEHKNMIEIIQKNIKRMNGMVDNLLIVEKKKTKIDTSFLSFDPIPIIKEIIQLNQYLAEKKNLMIYTDLEKDTILYGNKSDFYHVINNIFINAIKYTKQGYVKIALKKTEKNFGLIQIIDTGIGIAHKFQSVIFERFYRVPSKENKNVGGTGLGLSIAHSFVEKMNGMITIDSSPIKGSCFNVYIPICKNTK